MQVNLRSTSYQFYVYLPAPVKKISPLAHSTLINSTVSIIVVTNLLCLKDLMTRTLLSLLLCLPLLNTWGEETKPVTPPATPGTSPVSAPSASEKPDSSKPSPYVMILDYLPLALWDGEPISLCLRLENTLKQPGSVSLTVQVLDDADRPLKEVTETVELPASGLVPWRRDFQSPGVEKLKATLKSAEGETTLNVRFIREKTPWPVDAQFKAGRWFDAAKNEHCVLITHRRVKEGQRAFAVVAWLKGDEEEKVAEKTLKTLLCVPGGWFGAKDLEGNTLAQLGPYREIGGVKPGVPPLLMAASELLSKIKEAPAERLVILLPPEDLEFATDQRLYRIVTQSLMARLVESGVKKILLIPPFKHGASLPQTETFQLAVRESTEGFPVKVLDLGEGASPKFWQLSPNVFGNQPNDEGRAWITQKLLNK